eukprot:g2079.t1
MNTAVEQLLTDKTKTALNTSDQISPEKRLSSGPISDLINNRSMSSAGSPAIPEPHSSTEREVATWLESTQSPMNSPNADSEETEKPNAVFEEDAEDNNPEQELLDSIPEADALADAYQQWLMQEEAKIRESAVQGSRRFVFQDIMDNPDLANAAKQELAPKTAPTAAPRAPVTPRLSTAGSMISLADSRVSRLEHMVSLSENLDRDADKDAQVGSTELGNLLQRLKLGKKACQGLLNYVRKLHKTESLYCAALIDCIRPGAGGKSVIKERGRFSEATESLIALPVKVHSAHSATGLKLSNFIKQVEDVLKQVNGLIKELESYPMKMAKDIKMKKIALSRSKLRHEVLCKKLVQVDEEDSTATRAASDPWFTEGQVAHNYTQLIHGQANVQKLLANAYEKVFQIEIIRLKTAKQVIAGLLDAYGYSISEVVQPFAEEVSVALQQIDLDDEIVDLKQGAESSQQSERMFISASTDEEIKRFHEVFQSPDIVYQGTLQILDKDDIAWKTGHFVLTRSGLYWFLNKNEASHPDKFISLSRTSIEQVKAPLIKLIEKGPNPLSSSQSFVLKAPSIESCADWTMHFRERAASFSGMKK